MAKSYNAADPPALLMRLSRLPTESGGLLSSREPCSRATPPNANRPAPDLQPQDSTPFSTSTARVRFLPLQPGRPPHAFLTPRRATTSSGDPAGDQRRHLGGYLFAFKHPHENPLHLPRLQRDQKLQEEPRLLQRDVLQRLPKGPSTKNIDYIRGGHETPLAALQVTLPHQLVEKRLEEVPPVGHLDDLALG